jgi:hypothetical protein
MAKVKRSVIKEIVKECLLEILFEGIDSEPGYDEEPIREARQPRRRATRPSFSNKQQPIKKSIKKEGFNDSSVTAAVAELTDNSMMAGILADTAQTTLMEQKEGRRVPADNAAAAIESVDDMSQIFENAGNWAAIAFDERE